MSDELTKALTDAAISQAGAKFSDAVRGLRCPAHRMRASVKVIGGDLHHLTLNIKACCSPFAQWVRRHLQGEDNVDSPTNTEDRYSITSGTMTLQDYTNRRRFAEHQDFQDATPRLLNFIHWIDSDENGKQVLSDLRTKVDVDKLLENRSYNNPPQPGTPEEVAAIALAVIDTAKERNTQLFQISMAIGVRSSSAHIQDSQNEFENRYLSPLLDYLENRLFGAEGAAEIRPVAKNTNDVFIVHGHDEELKEAVARFLTKLGLNPIILHEQPNKGRTIIEKFEDCAEVSFAIVLLTPDDEGNVKGGELRPRPRQNVVLELGYFLGRLGRGRVAAIYRGDNLELPSDYQGVLFTPYDPRGGWRLEVVRELKAAEFPVDANQAF